MQDQKIRIRLPNAREKLQSLFPEDNRGDIRIEFGAMKFKLQKAFLRLESTYFKKSFTANQQVLVIQEKFNPNYFTNVLRCFYGYTIEISRSEVISYYPIVKFLEVQSLIKILREDMITKAQHYDIFVLMQLAHTYDEQEIFETCLSHLEKEDFEQLRYAKLQLLRCPIELFKMVIKTHNRSKAEKHKGIQFVEIDQLIKEFSDEKRMNEGQYQELKFQLIDKNSLTSQQYKQIFLDDAKRKKTNEYSSMIRMQPDKPTNSFRDVPFMSSRLTQSLITPNMINPILAPIQKANDQLTLEMEHTWQKKKNQQLKCENELLLKQLEQLKDMTSKNKKNFDQLKETVFRLQKQVEQKQKLDKEQSNTIKRLTKTCEDLKKELNEKGEVIKRLEQKVSKLEKMPDKMPEKRMSAGSKYLPIDDEGEESRTIQSQIVPGHLLKQIAKPAAQALSSPPNNGFKKAKATAPVIAVMQQKVEQQQPDQQSIEQLYTSRLAFDYEPRSCQKKMLPNLANMLTNDGFQKKMLNLIYRRNISNQQSRGNAEDLFNRDSLLVLILTRMGQVIGGYTTIEIQKGEKDYIRDDYAFIFNLSKNQKFSIKKNAEGQAIFITSDYLMCFSNDLMISIDPIKTQSLSDWPCAYEGGKEKRSSKWLTGEDGQFSIKEIEVYQVKQEAMIMDL